MAYQVNRYNGSFLVSVADGTIDSTTDLRFVGKNYAGYGQVQNENFLHLLEHFAGASQPSKPVSGQLWYDSSERKVKVYDGIRFRLVGGSVANSAPPTGLAPGEFWFDSLAQQLYCYTGSEFTLIGPENSSSLGETSVTTQVVKDATGLNKTIAKLQSGGSVIAIISKEKFNLNTAINPIAGFTLIEKGITLVDTDATTGVTSSSSGAIYWGTSSNSKKLNGFDDTDFVKTSASEFTSSVNLKAGLTVGPTSNPTLKVLLEDSSKAVFQNEQGDQLKFNIRVSSGVYNTVATFGLTEILPGDDSKYALGSADLKWSQLYVDNIAVATGGFLTGNVIGNITGNLTGNTVGTHTGPVVATTVTASSGFVGNLTGESDSAKDAKKLAGVDAKVEATGGTIALRDASGNMYATSFLGISQFSDRIKVDNNAVDSEASSYKTAKTNKSPNSIAARDPAGNLSAVIFNGTATSVQGADLAEKYLADQSYEVGTVVMVGGQAEITASTWGKRAIGVVSGNPGLMMNQDLENGVYVALKGRVPVKVIGSIKKGDVLIAANNGCAMAGVHHSNEIFAVALETDLNTDVKIVEAIVL
jgi:hypothetical protein